MKKSSIFLMAAVALGLAACHDDHNGFQQVNPQEPVMAADGVEVAIPEASKTAVVLADFQTDESSLIPVLNITKLEDFPTYYNVKGVMQYASDANFSDYVEVPLITEGMDLYADVAAWETAHINLYSKNPRKTQSYVRFVLYAINGSTEVRLGDASGVLYWAQHALEVTPLPAETVVEEAYYLIVDGVATIDMNASNPADVYDPPYFSAKVDVPLDGQATIQVKSQSGKLYGSSEEGKLVENGAPIILAEAGPRLVTVDMERLTYKVDLAVASVWAYNAQPSSGYELYTYDYMTYNGFAGFRGANATSFRLADSNTAPTMYWGCALNDKEDPIEGQLALYAADPTPIPLPTGGCYWLTADLSTMTYNFEKIKSFDLIGINGDWNTDIVMTATDKYSLVWTAEADVTGDCEFKIRTNGNWEGPDLGGGEDKTDFANLVEHGGNLHFTLEPGTYVFTLDLGKLPYSLNVVKK